MNDLYPEGFVTPVESEDFEPGLTRDTVLKLSAMKDEPEWLTEFRLKAFDHLQTIKEPEWGTVNYNPIDYQGMRFYSAPKFTEEGDIPQDVLDTFEYSTVLVLLLHFKKNLQYTVLYFVVSVMQLRLILT